MNIFLIGYRCSGKTSVGRPLALESGCTFIDMDDEIVKKAVALYKPRLREKPVGISFTEAYDLDTLQPNAKWQEVYDRVKNEVRDWGLPLA